MHTCKLLAVRFLLGLNFFSCKLLACLHCSLCTELCYSIRLPPNSYLCVLLQACIATASLCSLSTETLLVNQAVVKDDHAIAALSTIINDVLWLRASCTVASGVHQCHNCVMQQRTNASTEVCTRWLPRLRNSSVGVSSQSWYFMTDSVSTADSLIISDTTLSVLNASCQ